MTLFSRQQPAFAKDTPDCRSCACPVMPVSTDGPNWALDLPLKRSQLKHLLERAERYQGTERRHRITGTSHPIRAVRRLIEQVADFDTNVLVTGQSGTGKELVARTIHDLSARADKPFVPINCGAIPGGFARERAVRSRKRRIHRRHQRAHRSLRAGRGRHAVPRRDRRHERRYAGQSSCACCRNGRSSASAAARLQRCDVRIIAATHKDLPNAVKDGEFREDLFYRLNVFPIEMPPLVPACFGPAAAAGGASDLTPRRAAG